MKYVYVLGELNVDLIATGKDVTPEWNREKLVDSFDLVLGSSSAITACGLAGLKLPVRFIGVIGDDAFGRFAVSELQRHGVDTRYIIVDDRVKTGVTLSLSTEKDRALLTYMGAIERLRPELLPSDWMDDAAHVHFGSYYLQHGMRKAWPDLFKEARKRGITTSFDTGWDPEEDWDWDCIQRLLAHTSLFMPSEEEAGRISGGVDAEAALNELERYGEWVAVKCGSHGSIFSDAAKRHYCGAPYRVTPIDTTGAGDSFNAGLIYAFLSGMPPEQMLQFANACGAIATQRIGGASSVPSVANVLEFMKA